MYDPAHDTLMIGRTTTPPMVYRNLVSVPVALHLGVLALYITMCIVWLTGVLQNIQVTLADASRVQTWINLASHVRVVYSSVQCTISRCSYRSSCWPSQQRLSQSCNPSPPALPSAISHNLSQCSPTKSQLGAVSALPFSTSSTTYATQQHSPMPS